MYQISVLVQIFYFLKDKINIFFYEFIIITIFIIFSYIV